MCVLGLSENTLTLAINVGCIYPLYIVVLLYIHCIIVCTCVYTAFKSWYHFYTHTHVIVHCYSMVIDSIGELSTTVATIVYKSAHCIFTHSI